MDLPIEIWHEIITALVQTANKRKFYSNSTPFKLYFLALVSKAHYKMVQPLLFDYFQRNAKLASFGDHKYSAPHHLCAYFGRKGYLSCLKYAHEFGCKWNVHTTIAAVRAQQFETFKYLYENGCPVDNNILTMQIQNSGNIRFCQFAKQIGLKLGIAATYGAAQRGSLECLQFLHENGVEWDRETCAKAAAGRSLECLKYAHENGCPWDSTTPDIAAAYGSLECLKYARENGCPWEGSVLDRAGEGGHLDCLAYGYKEGLKSNLILDGILGYSLTFEIAVRGHLDCLKFVRDQGYPCDAETCLGAARGGSLSCLKYLHESGVPWDYTTCVKAADSGSLECLKYAHENGCDWNAEVCTAAAMRGHLDCLKYAHEHGCPWNESTTRKARESITAPGVRECLQYAVEKGCPHSVLDEPIELD